MNIKIIFAVLVVALFFTTFATASEGKRDLACKACKAGCIFISNETKKALCEAGCSLICKKSDEVESEKIKWKKIGKKVKKAVKKNKCKLCNAGCEFINDSTKKSLCKRGCAAVACKHAVVQSESAKINWKCKGCKAGCQFINDESKKALCVQACEQFACKKKDEVESDKFKMKKFIKKAGRKLKSRKCSLCKKGCSWIKDEKKRQICSYVCQKTACKNQAQSDKFKLKKYLKKGKKLLKKKGRDFLKKKGKEYLKRHLFMSESESEFLGKKGKCNACKAGCQFISNEGKKALCLQGCSLIC